uniref:methyltransferase domain-containing protein n=1 Tax=Stappia sp. TaxID=1870903 RepID=UPI003BABB3C1
MKDSLVNQKVIHGIQKLHEGAGLELARDNVAKAYMGQWGGAETIEKLRRRIHWIARQAYGNRVLDVGTSEGILPILLGREGFEVVGIDINGEAIDYANKLLEHEDPAVRERVRFFKSSLYQDQPTPHFDTVILGEVIEHITAVDRFISRALEHLKDEGRLIVTTPFGVFPDPDHKTTFYLSDLVELLHAHGSLEHLSVDDGYIRVVVKKTIPTATSSSEAEALLRMTESAAHDHAVRLYRQLDERDRRLQELMARGDAGQQKLTDATTALASQKEKYRQLEDGYRQLEKRLSENEETIRARDEALRRMSGIEAERETLRSALEQAHADRTQVEQALKVRLTAAETELHLLREQKVTDQDRRDQAELTAKELESELDKLRTAFSEEKQTLVDRIAESDTENSKLRSSLAQARQESSTTAAEIDGLAQSVLTQRLSKAALGAERDRSASENASLRQSLYEALEENESLRKVHEARHKERLHLEQELERDNGRLREESERASKRQQHFQKQLAERHSLAKAQRSRIAELTADNQDLRSRLETMIPAHDRDGDLFWVSPVADLITTLAPRVKPLKIADTCTSVAKSLYGDDPARALVLAAVAHHLDPKPYREKWLGFCLLKSGLPTAAHTRLSSAFSAVEFSASEKRHYDELVTQMRAKEASKSAQKQKASAHWPRVHQSMRVAGILDDFTFACMSPECDFLQLTPANWKEELERFQPELLLIESAWRGKDEKWAKKIGHLSSELTSILSWCKENGVPTAFWNKEDPVHFETFLNTANHFDAVFTTDFDCIGKYKAALGHENVYLLPFACQPAIHNPVEKYARKDAFCFAGAYYTRYPERTENLENFLEHLSTAKHFDIYDRNFGKNDPAYQFPEKYSPYILGSLPFDEIDKAYKGYRYAINLNSVKNSQTMFARRVYELLASNTIVLSNFSRGVRTLFGDLVISSDSGEQALDRLTRMESLPFGAERVRLAALRKALQEHTYEHRLAYIAEKTGVRDSACLQRPHVTMVAMARDGKELEAAVGHFKRQRYDQCSLVVFAGSGAQSASRATDEHITILRCEDQAYTSPVNRLVSADDYISPLAPEDYYGPHYLTDLVAALGYVDTPVITKGSFVRWSNEGLALDTQDGEYRTTRQVAARRTLFHGAEIGDIAASALLENQLREPVQVTSAFSIDQFNYCQDGSLLGTARQGVEDRVDDLKDLALGVSLPDILHRAERVAPAMQQATTAPSWTAASIVAEMSPPKDKSVTWVMEGDELRMSSTLPDKKHTYVYQRIDHHVETLPTEAGLPLHLETTPGLNVRWVTLFLDKNKERLGHSINTANKNATLDIPAGTEWIRFGFRIYGPGEAGVQRLLLGRREPTPISIINPSNTIIVTNQYPSYDDIYRNAFVHRRAVLYRERGLEFDLYTRAPDADTSFNEYENIDYMRGSNEQLAKTLGERRHLNILVHFLDQNMWSSIEPHSHNSRITIWIHGAEIQPWWRRPYNYQNEKMLEAAKARTEQLLPFWRDIFMRRMKNVRFVFVSRTFFEEVMDDYKCELLPWQYSIIHNPIDTKLFKYQPKSPEQRKNILSIRSFASPKYANDLTASAILSLKDEDIFDDISFTIFGDGKLFDEITGPLQGLPNVKICKGFLQQKEIADLQKSHGVLLTPTRWDSQGVSRDEGMSSGLVPITSDVAAVPEFVDNTCGFLAPPDTFKPIAEAIKTLYYNPDLFLKMSHAAAAHVREISSEEKTISEEINLIT